MIEEVATSLFFNCSKQKNCNELNYQIKSDINEIISSEIEFRKHQLKKGLI